MRVLRLTPHFYFPPGIINKWYVHLDPIGGMQTQIYRLALSLAENDIQQTIFTIGMKNAPKKWRLGEKIEVCAANIPVIPIRSRVRGSVGLNIYWGIGVVLRVFWIFLKTFLGGKEKYDIIHSHCSGVAAPLIVGLLSKWILRRPLVYTVHCCRISTYEPMTKFDKFINKYVIKIEEECLTKADSIIVLTERTKNLIMQRYKKVNADKMYIIPDMISMESYQQNVTQEKIDGFYKKFKIPSDKRIVSFVGRIAHEKGWSYLVEAINLLKDDTVHFVFCGDGNERSYLDQMIEQLGIKSKVTVTGFIPNDLVAVGIYISEVLIIPSVHEEFGSLILEVASLKRPVIAAAVGGLTENIKDGVSGILVPPKSPAMIAEKLRYLLDNEDIREEYGQELHQSILHKFDASNLSKKLMECYRDTYKIFDKGSIQNVNNRNASC